MYEYGARKKKRRDVVVDVVIVVVVVEMMVYYYLLSYDISVNDNDRMELLFVYSSLIVVTCFHFDRYHPAYCTSLASSSLVVNGWLMMMTLLSMTLSMTEQRRCKLTSFPHNISSRSQQSLK